MQTPRPLRNIIDLLRSDAYVLITLTQDKTGVHSNTNHNLTQQQCAKLLYQIAKSLSPSVELE